MPRLLQASNRLWFPGQVKPTGVPRIDWQHPLANGLVFYAFDTGQNAFVDLAAQRSQLVISGDAALGGNSPWGAGLQFSANGTRYFLSDPGVQLGPPYTVAFACDQTGADGTIFTRLANNNGSNPFINWQFASTGGFIETNINSAGSFTAGPGTLAATFLNNAFNSVALVIPIAGTSAILYSQAKVQQTTTGLTVQSANTGDQIDIGGSGTVNVANAFTGLFFYGGTWNRALTAAELLLLHTDPYCFLMPTEAAMPVAFLPNANVTVALTGQAITSHQGALAPATALGLSGQRVTTGQGAVVASGGNPVGAQSMTGGAIGVGVGVGLMNFTGSAASPPPPPPPGGSPALDFNEAGNSQYVILGVV